MADAPGFDLHERQNITANETQLDVESVQQSTDPGVADTTTQSMFWSRHLVLVAVYSENASGTDFCMRASSVFSKAR